MDESRLEKASTAPQTGETPPLTREEVASEVRKVVWWESCIRGAATRFVLNAQDRRLPEQKLQTAQEFFDKVAKEFVWQEYQTLPEQERKPVPIGKLGDNLFALSEGVPAPYKGIDFIFNSHSLKDRDNRKKFITLVSNPNPPLFSREGGQTIGHPDFFTHDAWRATLLYVAAYNGGLVGFGVREIFEKIKAQEPARARRTADLFNFMCDKSPGEWEGNKGWFSHRIIEQPNGEYQYTSRPSNSTP